MLRHMFTSPTNMYLRDRDRPKGAMRPMPNLMETELETFGAATVEDFTWKQLLDTDSCTMCGRCTVCPAHATGKPLDPCEIVLKTGEVMAATGTPVVSPPIGTVAEITIGASSLFERITPEEIWACTTCKACDENCPVNIEILDKILDMRRYLSLMESNFPTELGTAYRGMENSGNPWGMSQGDRANWTSKLEGIEIVDGSSPFDHEYLYWVGCAGSFDDKNQKVTQSMAKLMQRAGIDFAILGPAEMYRRSARRSGNEYIFQMLAMQNIETLNGMGVKKIVTQCPHCFNTLLNEYPQLGGHYEVVHHSQFLDELIADGRLDMTGARLEDRIVYHDSCYLGSPQRRLPRPRRVIGSIGGMEVVEAPRSGTRACAAARWRPHVDGGVHRPKVNDVRAWSCRRPEPPVAAACPFCYIMMDDGVKAAGKDDDEVKVGDIAMHVLEAIEAADAGRAGPASPSPKSPFQRRAGGTEAAWRCAIGSGRSSRSRSALVGAGRPRRPRRLRAARAHPATSGDRCDGPTTSTRWPTRWPTSPLHRARRVLRGHRRQPQAARRRPQQHDPAVANAGSCSSSPARRTPCSAGRPASTGPPAPVPRRRPRRARRRGPRPARGGAQAAPPADGRGRSHRRASQRARRGRVSGGSASGSLPSPPARPPRPPRRHRPGRHRLRGEARSPSAGWRAPGLLTLAGWPPTWATSRRRPRRGAGLACGARLELHLRLDGFAALMALLVAGVGVAVFAYSLVLLRRERRTWGGWPGCWACSPARCSGSCSPTTCSCCTRAGS